MARWDEFLMEGLKTGVSLAKSRTAGLTPMNLLMMKSMGVDVKSLFEDMGKSARGETNAANAQTVTPPTPGRFASVADQVTPPSVGLRMKPTGTAYDPSQQKLLDLWTERQKVPIAIGKEVKKKWNTAAADKAIKFDVMSPKLNNFMELGGRAYQELRNTAKGFGINLNYETGGLNALIAAGTKNVAMKTKLAPLMVALDRLRPELGTELMRQLGAFRSAQMAKRFEDTLAQFSGDIREDIANMSTTLTKNKANVVLLDENGERLSNVERNQKMIGFEANLIRKYNYMYRKMGLMTKPYTAQRSFKWLAENSEFNEGELKIINNAVADNKKYSRTDVISKLIERGIL